MHGQDTITSPRAESMGSEQKLGTDGGETGSLPHLSVVPTPEIKVILSYTPASFWSRDMAKGISQLPYPKAAAPKSQNGL